MSPDQVHLAAAFACTYGILIGYGFVLGRRLRAGADSLEQETPISRVSVDRNPEVKSC